MAGPPRQKLNRRSGKESIESTGVQVGGIGEVMGEWRVGDK